MDPPTHHIRTAWNGGPAARRDLTSLFGVIRHYGVDTRRVEKILAQCISDGLSDFDIVNRLARFTTSSKNHGIDTNSAHRAANRANDIARLLDRAHVRTPSAAIYLDIGAGNTLITQAVARELKLPLENVNAVDIAKWIGNDNTQAAIPEALRYHIIDPAALHRIPIATHSVNLITVFQALHHFTNIDVMMGEIRRLCSGGGIVIIREHNIAPASVAESLVYVEHLLYSVFADRVSTETFAREYYGNYKTIDMWNSLFADHGFRCLYHEERPNPTRYCYVVYQSATGSRV